MWSGAWESLVVRSHDEIAGSLTRFYSALLECGDIEEAAAWVTPDFRLEPNRVVGLNYNADDPDLEEIQDNLSEIARELARGVPAGSAQALLRAVYEQRGGDNRQYPFWAWTIESIHVVGEDDALAFTEDARRWLRKHVQGEGNAHAVTKDASCWLRKHEGRWRVAWVLY